MQLSPFASRVARYGLVAIALVAPLRGVSAQTRCLPPAEDRRIQRRGQQVIVPHGRPCTSRRPERRCAARWSSSFMIRRNPRQRSPRTGHRKDCAATSAVSRSTADAAAVVTIPGGTRAVNA